MPTPGTTLGIAATAGLVVGGRSLLIRGVQGGPVGRVAAVAPVWRVAIGQRGPISWRVAGRPQHAAGLLVPPEVGVDARSDDAIAILHLEAEGFGLLPRPTAGGPDVVPLFTAGPGFRMLWSVTDARGLDLVSAEAVRELRAGRLIPPVSARDRRVAAGIERARDLGSITEGAATVGLSMTRFRRLVREQTGTSPARLRTWRRLRHALEMIDQHDLAEIAAIAGFADQAHLTRTCTRFVGASPGRLRGVLRHRPS